MLEVDVCVVGAGPVGGTLGLPPGRRRRAGRGRGPGGAAADGAPGFRRARLCGGRRVAARCWRRPGVWAMLPLPVCPIEDIRVSDGRVGRKASPLFLHFDHHEAGDEPFGWMVEARSLRVALNAHLHALPALHVFAPAEATVERDAEGAVVQVAGGPALALPAGRGRRGPRLAPAPAGRHRGDHHALPAARPRLRHRARAAAPQHRARALPARRPVRATADGRHRGRAERLRHRLDRARRARRPPDRRSTTPCSAARSPAASARISAPSGRSAGAGSIRSRPCTRSATSTPAWPWSATPRTASTRSPARASTSASAT